MTSQDNMASEHKSDHPVPCVTGLSGLERDLKEFDDRKNDKPPKCCKCHRNLTPEEIKKVAVRREAILAKMSTEERFSFEIRKKLGLKLIQATRAGRENPADEWAILSGVYQELEKNKEWVRKDK